MYYRNAAAACVVYDITDLGSFDVLQAWVKELKV
jgi:GTPase SAR1 family protein